jgi:AMP nucleosidase
MPGRINGPVPFLTTNKRVWEYDERFKKYLEKTRAMAIDMETATFFL